MKNKYEIKMTSRLKKDLKIVRKRNYFDADLMFLAYFSCYGTNYSFNSNK